jgi:hypothetical protein
MVDLERVMQKSSLTYRLYFVDASLSPHAPHLISAADDASALAAADRMFAVEPAAASFTLVAPLARRVATKHR